MLLPHTHVPFSSFLTRHSVTGAALLLLPATGASRHDVKRCDVGKFLLCSASQPLASCAVRFGSLARGLRSPQFEKFMRRVKNVTVNIATVTANKQTETHTHIDTRAHTHTNTQSRSVVASGQCRAVLFAFLKIYNKKNNNK